MKTMRFTLVDPEDSTGNGNITILLHWDPVTEVNINDILTIQVHNVWGDKATAPAFLNQLGMIRADANRKARLKKLERDCLYSELYEQCETGMTITIPDPKKGIIDRAPSSAKVEAAVKRKSEYKKACVELINAEQVAEQLDSIYWAMVTKIKQLADFKTDLKPVDLIKEIVEEQINGFFIKKENGKLNVTNETR